MAFDIYAAVTDRITAELEKGIIPWERPWGGVRSGAISHSTGKPYSLINQLLLGKPGEYITFKQCTAEGGKIKKGAHSRMIVFWKMIRKGKTDANGQPVRDADGMPIGETIPVLRYFNVFHIEDCEGIEPKYKEDELPTGAEPIDEADRVIADYASRAKLQIENHKQNEAYYAPGRHVVRLPLMEQFENSSAYYATTFHELVHSTGHKTLLNRFSDDAAAAAFGSESYSKEELIAEIGSCSIVRELGLETEKTFRNNAAYIQSWLRALKNDKRMIVSAASRAEKAINLILNRQDTTEQE